MGQIERFVVDIDSHPWNAVFRGAIGFLMPPVFRMLVGDHGPVWVAPVLFLGLLIGLRAWPVVLRRLLPFSAKAKETWAARRALSKEFDSYAWQRLFWFGPGILLYGASGGGLQTGELAVALFCLIGGGAGLLVWRSARAVASVQ
jgi:hypothetical protein